MSGRPVRAVRVTAGRIRQFMVPAGPVPALAGPRRPGSDRRTAGLLAVSGTERGRPAACRREVRASSTRERGAGR
jgi:hypothetical protein